MAPTFYVLHTEAVYTAGELLQKTVLKKWDVKQAFRRPAHLLSRNPRSTDTSTMHYYHRELNVYLWICIVYIKNVI